MPEKIEYQRTDTKKKKKERTPEQILSSLMALCAKAERSSGDAMRLMSTWGVEKSAQKQILDKLISEKFIDDSRYASAFVREKTNLAGWGEFKLRAKLSAKGIAKNIIDEALSSHSKDSYADKLYSMLEKKKRSVKSENEYELKGKLFRYAMSQGYSYDVVMEQVEKVMSGK